MRILLLVIVVFLLVGCGETYRCRNDEGDEIIGRIATSDGYAFPIRPESVSQICDIMRQEYTRVYSNANN